MTGGKGADWLLQIFLDCIDILTLVHDELDDPSMMVTPLQLSNQLLDWTDPQKAVYVAFPACSDLF